MDLDDFTRYWKEKSIIIRTYGKEFNNYLYKRNAPVMTMEEYERAFFEWYASKKRPVSSEG